MLEVNPEDDGYTHINVYSRGRTELGRFLSNFAHTPVKTPDGDFESLEGYWYWLKTYDEGLRSLYGIEAKRYGRSLPVANSKIDRNRFKKAIVRKIYDHKEWLKDQPLWNDITIPLTHYYVYDGKKVEANGEWVIDILEQLRYDMKD